MAGALELLEAAHEERDAQAHLRRECPWFRHVEGGGREHADLHCRPPGEGGALVKFTPRTPEASTVPQPTVPPGGPGLWHVKGMELPPYVQHLYKHLVGRYGKHGAYRVAVGVVKKWAAGVNPGGKHPTKTHPDVRAAAQKNVADWEEKRARAHAEHAAASAVELAGEKATAPGARPFFVPPTPGGQYQQYGLHQTPVQSAAPSPPLPPSVPMPTAAEVRAVIPLVPESTQAGLSATARKFLEQAAGKLERNSPIEALGMMRSAQAAMYAAHKADQGNLQPSAYTANVFTRVPAVGQSSATAAMKTGMDQALRWRKAEMALGALSDRIRKRYFHGVYNGPSQMARFSEDGMSALDRVLALAGAAITTGKDVSEPVESDTSGATPLLQAPEGLLDVSASPDAARQLASLPPLDRQRVDAYLGAARRMAPSNPMGASQFALRACAIAGESGAHHLARHIRQHIAALAEGRNLTNPADAAARMQVAGRTVSPANSPQTVADTGNGPMHLSALERLQLASAGSSAGSSAGFGSVGAAERLGRLEGTPVTVAPARKTSSRSSSSAVSTKGGPVLHTAAPPPGEPGPVSMASHLHALHVQHVNHVHQLNMQHADHLHHLIRQHLGGAG
jgi:hypothetical protein